MAKKTRLQTLVLSLVTVGVATSSLAVMAADDSKSEKAPVEKCYGIALKGKNDCKADGHSCAGLSTKDKDAAEYILVPEGTCKKIVGGSTTKK